MQYPYRAGAEWSRAKTTFRLWAPSAREVLLRLYRAGTEAEQKEAYGLFSMCAAKDGMHTVTVPGNLHGVYYDFLLKDENGAATVSADPWAVACGANGCRSMVVDLRSTDPEGWDADRRVGKTAAPVIWETHVGDFSANAAAGAPAEWRGKYSAFTLQDTTLRGEGVYPTLVNHLKYLGVTHVQLQPIADYATVDETREGDYNWGYDIMNYNCPEGGFSTDPFHGEVRIRECKEMIRALHSAGIGVILDVVYNHTFYSDSWLHRTAPGEYYRMAEDGSFLNGSGCGNETASERMPFRNYMIQSLLYWVEEYHVDGFRFDLMGVHDVETMRQVREALDALPDGENILTYGEPWWALPPGIREPDRAADKGALKLLPESVGAFSDRIRNALIGDCFNSSVPGYFSGGLDEWRIQSIKSAICGDCEERFEAEVSAPTQSINYVSCHDNFALWDRLVLHKARRLGKEAQTEDFMREDRELEQRNRLAAGIYMLCEGMAFFLAGEEFCRTKCGEDNTYNGPSERNALPWEHVEDRSDLVKWYRGIIALRKEIITLLASAVREIEFPEEAMEPCVVFRKKAPEGSRFEEFLVCFNPLEESIELTLPAGKPFMRLCDGKRTDLSEKIIEGKVEIGGISAAILAR